MNPRRVSLLLFALCFLPVAVPAGAQQRLDTIAEKSNFTATSRHADVLKFCEDLAKLSPVVRLGEMGTTNEGRKLPLIIIADPPISTPEEAAKSGKLVVFAMGNIHAGEVDGKEGLMMYARDIALAKERPLLKNLILVFAPNFNADGGDKVGTKNRPGQAGPPEVGVRANAQGFDLNRDFVKLESPEVQSLVRLFRQWDPAIFMDLHTTNGSAHRYTLTYDRPRHPSNDTGLLNFMRDALMPEIGKHMEKATGYKTYYYGNYGKGNTTWTTTPAEPRYGFHYYGFRNRMGVLSESYSYAPYRDRVLASRALVSAVCDFAAANKDKIRKVIEGADKANRDAAPGAKVAIRHKMVSIGDKVKVLGVEGAKTLEKGGKAKDYQVDYFGKGEPTLTVARPYAYLFPASFAKAVENLQRHGIEVEELREDVQLDVEVYRIGQVDAKKPFQKHNLVSVEATARKDNRRVPAGTILVRTNQDMGNFATFLLEPQSEDGLCTWNYFDAGLKKEADYPVLRLPAKAALVTSKVRPLAEDAGPKKKLTPEMLDNGTLPNFAGDPVTVQWMDDGEYFLQVKEGQLLKVHATTGRSEPYHGPATGIAALEAAGPWHDGPFDLAPQKGKGKGKGAGGRELQSTAPGGKTVAFIRNNNLYLEDVESKKDRAVTTDGGEAIRSGKASWVYYEEVYGRGSNYKAYWWAPDGGHIAFLRSDESPMLKYTISDFSRQPHLLEVVRYPHAGEPNPIVKLAIAPVAGGEVRWVDLSEYDNPEKEPILITQVGWLPDGKTAYFAVQNRIQTWLDFCTVGTEGGRPIKLFRDTTKAWIEPSIPPRFLKDGSFLVSSERNGWKHLYHYDKSGKLLKQVTDGEWEMRSVQRVDEDEGWIYFSGTRDNLLAANSYRIRIDGTGLERITKGKKGSSEVLFSPRGDLFVCTYSDWETPPQVTLHRADGTHIRTLDTNPVYLREEYEQVKSERVQVPTPEGILLEGRIQKPSNFDPNKKYPVWFQTYGGPHAPRVTDGMGKGGGAGDQALANAGYIVFHGDPYPASGKGALSTWTTYRNMGVKELQDIETMIRWITKNPWADTERVGMSGSSFGGYITSYALTHSKLFAAGVASAPVTDWHLYDSIYTERYMDVPKDNQKGYEITSVIKGAKNLHGRLLIAHGLKDDNVHASNSIQLMQALQQAGKQNFEVMFYPLARHGGFGGHFNQLQREFMNRVLKPQP